MARKHNGTDSNELLQFDSRTKAVSAQVHTMDNMKEKISKVREISPSSSKDDIIQVLHHFDGDVDKSIDAYKRDGAQEILSQWNIPNRKGKGGNNQSKRSKKKKHKGGDVALPNGGDVEPTVPSNNNNIDKPTHPRIESLGHSNDHVPNNNNNTMPKDSTVQPLPRREPDRPRRESPKTRQEKPPGTSRSPRREPTRSENQSNKQREVDLKGRGGGRGEVKGQKSSDGRGTGQQQQSSTNKRESEKQRGHPHSRSNQQSGRRRKVSEGSDKGGDRERTTSESSTSQDKNKPKKPSEPIKSNQGAVLERVSKDLQRTQVSLTRHKNLLNEECDRSEKRLLKAFADIRLSCEHREMEMLRQLKEVKRTATILLENRQEKALELKMETAKAASMSEQKLSELRADIKHFVSERKIDEEIGRTMRFTWNPDPVEQAVKSLGEVVPVKTNYATRRPSITSDTSGTFSRTTSVSEDPSGPLSRSTSQIDSSVPATPTTPDMDMKAEVEHFAARLQRSLDSRGGPRRPRNDRSRSQGRPEGKNEQRGPKNQGVKNQGQEQQARGNQARGGQQGRRNRGGPSNRGGKDQDGPSRRERDRLSSSSSTGKGEEESPDGSPKKSRSARRREQYRRRHNQEKDGEENDTSKPVEKVASTPNKDSVSKTSEPKKVTIESKPTSSSDSKQKEVDTHQEEPVVNGMPTSKPETKVEDSEKPKVEDSEKPKVEDSEKPKVEDNEKPKVEDSEKPKVEGSEKPKVEDSEKPRVEDNEKPIVVDSNKKPDRPKDLNITQNGPKVVEKEAGVVSNHIEAKIILKIRRKSSLR
ncbi:LOW QUALITY PROTEIN: uncharacterized protein [Amphiura filiformis]|uniref:LOW QUALITY PROTEIN: uncharacterized protein n=1 Tax=Amphiura filiformis TaxID=82378 RepID=UPI003B21D0BD